MVSERNTDLTTQRSVCKVLNDVEPCLFLLHLLYSFLSMFSSILNQFD